jgi:hypothetical protein
MHAFVAHEGLARFCTADYEKPKRENYKKIYMHLTNYSVNKMNDDFKKSDNIMDENDDSKRSMTSLYKSLEA